MVRHRRRWVGTLLVVGSLVGPARDLAGQQADSALTHSPVGVWIYPGGDVEPARMTIRDDGRVGFEGSLAHHDSSSWTLTMSGSRSILTIRLPAMTSARRDVYAWYVEHGNGAYHPDSIDGESRTIHYDLSESPCRLGLGSLVLFRQSSRCPEVPGVNPYRSERRRPDPGDDSLGADEPPAARRMPAFLAAPLADLDPRRGHGV
ncbi:MAG: hypothetical protein ACODAE_04945 [Gemmatimonadota bacterium]